MRVRSISPLLSTLATVAALAAVVTGAWISPAASVEPAATASSDPHLPWVLSVPASSRLFASELGLSASQLETAQEVGRRVEASQTAELAESDRRIDAASGSQVKTAEATAFNSAVDGMQEQGIRDISTQLGKSEADVRTALAVAWAQQVSTFNEAASYNRVAASLGVASYRVTATSFTGVAGRGVAVPDKYVKFAAKGWRSSIPSQYQSAYPAGGRYAVGIAWGTKTVASAPVIDVGPWNIDDNYWNSRFDPVRPRRLFKDVPQGTPEAAAAIFNGYNGGKDQFGRKVLNAAGLDILWPTWADLGADVYAHKGYKDWVTVWFLWEPGTSLPPVAEGRLAGSDRYATSLAVSKRGWGKVPAVVLATGADFADALPAGPLAATYGGPVLLVDPVRGMTTALAVELARLAPKRIFIVGGAAAVSTAVEATCRTVTSKPVVRRIAGSDRWGTSAAVARTIEESTHAVSRVVVVNGLGYADALAAVPVASVNRWPILLATKWGLPWPTKVAVRDLAPTSSLIVGGTGVLGTAVEKALPAPYRLAGRDRYETAAKVAGYSTLRGCSFRYVAVAPGQDFPDALSAGPLAGVRRGVVALVQPRAVPDYTATMLRYVRGEVAYCDAVGGTSVVPDSVMVTVHKLLRP